MPRPLAEARKRPGEREVELDEPLPAVAQVLRVTFVVSLVITAVAAIMSML